MKNAEVKEHYQVEICNSFAAFEDFGDKVGIQRPLKYFRQNVSISAKQTVDSYELKQQNTKKYCIKGSRLNLGVCGLYDKWMETIQNSEKLN